MSNIELTFPSTISDAELLVIIGNNVSISVYEGKTASFDKKDINKIFSVIKHIVNEEE